MASKKKNHFVFETGLTERAMLLQRRGQPIYRLIANPKIQLQYCRFGHVNNTRVFQASKLVDEIDFREATGFDKSYSSDSKLENKDSDNEFAIINKVMDNNLKCIEQPYNICI